MKNPPALQEIAEMKQTQEDVNSAIERIQMGVSRPPLEVTDLPSPEEVFKVKKIGIEEIILLVLGPSLVMLGISIGSGEWLLGPLNVSKYGFAGIGWVILASIILQVFYNVELGRFTLATGESPILAFGRVPPGIRIWIPLAILSFYLSFITGSWTVSAGASLFALFFGRAYQAEELQLVRYLGIGLLFVSYLFVSFGQKIARTLEIIMGTLVTFILVSLIFVVGAVVPLSYIWESIVLILTPQAPPAGTDPSLLGALAGFAALAAGLNYIVIGLYRDKGYAMGHQTGYLSGLIGGHKVVITESGKIFPENDRNTLQWKRWFRFLLLDQWGIYFIGSVVGIFAPSILVGYLSTLEGAAQPVQENISTYAAIQLGQIYGPILFGWALLIGFMILFKTQTVILELLTRNFTEAAFVINPKLREFAKGDPRRIYYPFMLVLIILIGLVIHIALPGQLLLFSGNAANFASTIFPLAILYLNRKLPKPAKPTWWSYLVLILNTLFFGFFFVNFLATQITGAPLIKF
jgi:hypothetical protein